jgi:hypothetical protein
MEERTATRLHNKFLDLKINDCIQGFRENHKDEYKVIFDLLQLMGFLKDKFIGKDASHRDIFLLSSIIELNRLFQSAVLLFERGLPASANIIIRTILELSLNIVETIKNENYMQEIIFNEIKEARSTVNIAKEFNRLDLIPPEKTQEIQETYKLLVESNYKKKKSVKDLAQKNGFEVEYLLYRTYSGNTHISASTLAKNFNITSLGIIFDADIQLNDFKNDLRRLISIVIISLPTLIDDYFDDGDLKNQYNLICDDFERVFNN